MQCAQMTRWLWRRCPTRSHSELGRESLQRRWYFVLRHGRVGRCLVFWLHCMGITALLKHFCLRLPCLIFSRVFFFKDARFGAGWSSPVARQAHNLKVAGSNPAPATMKTLPKPLSDGIAVFCCLATANSNIAAKPPTS